MYSNYGILQLVVYHNFEVFMTNTQSSSNIKTIDDLKINDIYTNDIIAKVFRCSKQGGMRKSNTTNTLVLISKQTGKSVYHR